MISEWTQVLRMLKPAHPLSTFVPCTKVLTELKQSTCCKLVPRLNNVVKWWWRFARPPGTKQQQTDYQTITKPKITITKRISVMMQGNFVFSFKNGLPLICSLNWVNLSCFEKIRSEMTFTYLVRNNPCHGSSILLPALFGSMMLASFLNYVSEGRGWLHCDFWMASSSIKSDKLWSFCQTVLY